ncbi:zinc transporter ZupT [Catalinimonas niigatensis]|uniref:zinc transporter ZupT n=1 Tax=Catalinimonas niigatensis TaxID=1397264 RepID=UPI0026658431|nr:zinc transporter ZupT [Catalinimonas niigatensis]WPP50527.1 zinc transporter ZupT [Catalinimonas niigatensis]
MYDNVLFAFGLTLFAGLSTGIGSALAFFTRSQSSRFLSVSMGLSAGVMIYISFVELFATAQLSLVNVYGTRLGNWYTVLSFFAGILLIAIIDKFVPSYENPHEFPEEEEKLQDKLKKLKDAKLLRVGLFTALSLGIHNFPEGMATFISALKDVSLGLPIAIAIAIHNIPEGIAVSVPVYYATGSRKKAFTYSFLSGLSEPVGALVGYFILMPIINDLVFGILFALIAGIMVFISLDQLLPAAHAYGKHHHAIYGLIAGMVIMALSLLMFL